MKFGKLADISQVDFKLPDDPSSNESILSRQPKVDEQLPRFDIGCTGWSMKEWVGSVYPPGTKTKDYLRQYSRQFNTIELNTTHYRIPSTEMIQKWYSESADDFRFCPKIPQTISHSRDLGMGRPETLVFCEAVQGLEEKLGCCFMQLPPYFGMDRLPLLDQFLERFPNHIPLAIELRHESWFGPEQGMQKAIDCFEKHAVATVITDVAGRRDVLHMGLSHSTTMIRFVGNGLHPTDYSRIDEWVKRLSLWIDQGLQHIYFFPHEPDNLLAPELADYLAKKVAEELQVICRGPNLSTGAEGKQISLF